MVTAESKEIYRAALKVSAWENITIVEAITEVVITIRVYADKTDDVAERLRNINGPYGKVYWQVLKENSNDG